MLMSPTRTLAQLGNFINPAVPALPEPPAFQRFVFEAPLLPALALGLLAVVAFLSLRNAGRVKAGAGVMVGLLAVAGGLFVVAGSVETDRERLMARQDELVAAVANADLDALEDLLDEAVRIRVTGPLGIANGLDKRGIISRVADTTGGAYPVRDFGIIERQAVLDGPNAARTQVHVRVESRGSGGTFTWFRLGWRLSPDGAWRAIEIEPLFMSGVMPYQGG
jgi:hypothetical protein